MNVSKAHIIAEIQRTSRENDGVAPGKKRFQSLTGIAESDWYGRYWTRWSEALQEAGLQANQLQKSLPDELVLESLANLTQRLGRFPVAGEIRLEARNDPDFPSHNVFRRFGGKADLAQALLRHSEGRDDLPGVADAARQVASARRQSMEASDSEAVDSLGFVYLIRSGRFFKIGRTNAVGRREYELAIQLPEKVVLVHQIKTDDPVGIERYWHSRFGTRRRNGEWFELSGADVSAFKRRRFM